MDSAPSGGPVVTMSLARPFLLVRPFGTLLSLRLSSVDARPSVRFPSEDARPSIFLSFIGTRRSVRLSFVDTRRSVRLSFIDTRRSVRPSFIDTRQSVRHPLSALSAGRHMAIIGSRPLPGAADLLPVCRRSGDTVSAALLSRLEETPLDRADSAEVVDCTAAT